MSNSPLFDWDKSNYGEDYEQTENGRGSSSLTFTATTLFSAISAPMANATSVTSTVATVDNCKWAFGDAPSSLVMGAGAELYRGDPLRVSQVFAAPTLGLSGTIATALTGDSVECGFDLYLHRTDTHIQQFN